MDDDIVTRLRLWASTTQGDHVIEELHRAADEIERLRNSAGPRSRGAILMKLHFVETQQPLTRLECAELAAQLAEALHAKGRPNDQVVVLAQCTYGGNVDINDTQKGLVQ